MPVQPYKLWRFVTVTLEILMVAFTFATGAFAAERRAALTFAPGFLTAQSSLAYAAGAEAEWSGEGGISLRADLYALAAKSKPGVLQQSYQSMLGLVYTFTQSGPVAPFAGFQPGFGFASVTNGRADGLYMYPVMSPVVGLHLNLRERWYLTAHLRYVFGELHYADTGAVYLSELRAGVGLGFIF